MKSVLLSAVAFVAGVASAELRWDTSVNVPADFVPLTDNLMLGTTRNALTDGLLPETLNVDGGKQCWVSPGQVFTCTSDTPKDIKLVRVYSEWDRAYDGFSIDSVSVRYSGSDEYVVLDGSACPYTDYNKGFGHMAQLSDDNGGFIACGVTGVKIQLGQCDTAYGRCIFGEVEVQGFDAVRESVTAVYAEEGESLSVEVTAALGIYPAGVWLCTGDTDAGTDINAWASRKKIRDIISSSDVIEYGPDSDYGSSYRSCRVCVFSDYSKRYVWSDVRTVSHSPVASVSEVVADEVSATLSLVMTQAGFGALSANVMFAYARHGEVLPDKIEVASGLLPNAIFPVAIDGLVPDTEYDYEIEMTNDKGFSSMLSGTFSTEVRPDVGSANAWTVTAYQPAAFQPLADNMMLGVTGNALTDGKMSVNRNLNVDQVWWNVGVAHTCTSATPKDIKRIRVYSQWDTGYDGFGISSVSVRYAGTDEFTVLDGSELPLTDLNTGIGQCAEFADANGGFIACNVTGVRITLGAADSNRSSAIFSELEIQGFEPSGESVSASYAEVDGALSATVTAETSEPPVKIYFVSGAMDGGTDFSAWDNVCLIGTLEASSGGLDFGPDPSFGIDYRYCRFCYYSTYYRRYIWSDGYMVSAAPVADVRVAEVDETSASLVVGVRQLGYGASSVDVSFACAPHGEALPAKASVASGVTAVGELPVAVNGLANGIVYDYEFSIVNDNAEESLISGSFTTVPEPGDPDSTSVTYTWKTGLADGRWNSTASWESSFSPCYGVPSNSTYAAVVFPESCSEVVRLAGTYPVRSLSIPSGASVRLEGDGQVQSPGFSLYGTLELVGSAPVRVNGSIGPETGGRIYMSGLTQFPCTSYIYIHGNTAIAFENCNLEKTYAFALSGGKTTLAFTNTTFKSKGTNHYGSDATTILSGSTVSLELFTSKTGGDFVLDDSVLDLTGGMDGNVRSVTLSGADTVFGVSGRNFRFVDGSVSIDYPAGGFTNGAPIIAKNAALTNLSFSVRGVARSGGVRLPVLSAGESLDVDLKSLSVNIEDGEFKERELYIGPDGRSLWLRAFTPGMMIIFR